MASAGTFRVGGSKKLQNQLRALAEQSRKRAHAAVKAEAEETRDEARRNAPVDSGRLQASITADIKGLSARVYPRERYAVFVERGTSAQPEQPFMGPAGLRSRRRFGPRMRKAIAEGLR